MNITKNKSDELNLMKRSETSFTTKLVVSPIISNSFMFEIKQRRKRNYFHLTNLPNGNTLIHQSRLVIRIYQASFAKHGGRVGGEDIRLSR